MKRKVLGFILCIAVCVAACISVLFAGNTEVYTVDEPYVYPVVPRTEEWNRMSSLREKIEACYVDENLMRSMTTPALLETVLNYPLLANIYAFDTLEMGMASVSSYFKGIEILAQREDAGIYIEEYRQARACSEERTIVDIYLDTLAAWLEDTSDSASDPVAYDAGGSLRQAGRHIC